MTDLAHTTFPAMELRLADLSERVVEGIVVPWGEVSLVTGDPHGERFVRGALTRSIGQRGDRIKLFVDHQHKQAVGTVAGWKPNHPDGCWGAFRVKSGPLGDELLDDVRSGLLDGFSVGFVPIRERRGADGVREVVEAQLWEVSLVPIAAYDGARVLATRDPRRDYALPDPPAVNLASLPRLSRL